MGFALVMDLFQKKPFLTSSIILLLYGILQILWGDITPICNGYGSDGCLYGEITERFYEKVFVEKMNSYYVQRILPFGLMHYLLRFLQVPLEPFYIIKSFQIYNLILLLGINLLWFRIAEMYNFRVRIFWLGWIFTFVNMVIGRGAFYDAVLTDYTVYLLGFALLYAYLNNRLTAMVFISFLGTFTWPSFLYFAALLIIFPLKQQDYLPEYKTTNTFNYWIAILLPVAYFLYIAFHIKGDGIYWSVGIYEDKVEGNFYIFYISLLINFFFLIGLFMIYTPTFNQIFKIITKSLSKIKILNASMLIALFLLIRFLLTEFSLPEEQLIDPSQLIKTILFYSVLSPLFFLIEATTSFGIIFIILITYFSHIFRTSILKFGIGIYITFLIFILLRLIPESRLTVNYHPFFIFLICYSLKDFFISTKFLLLILGISLLFSRIYLSFIYIEEDRSYHLDGFGFFESIFINQFGFSRSYYLLLKFFAFTIFFIFIVYLNSRIKRHFYLRSEDDYVKI